MISMKGVAITLVLFFSMVTATVVAETLPSQLSVERGGDSRDGEDYFVFADIDLAGPRLFIGYGESDSQSGSTILNTTAKQISISSNPLADASIALGYSQWGQEGEINIDTYRLDLVFNSADWTFVLAPQLRDITLHTLLMSQPVLDIDSNGLNIGLSYYGWFPLSMGLTYSAHDYSRNLSSLATDPRLALIFSPATMEYAFGFEKERLAGFLNLNFDWGSLGLDGSRSISEVDNSVSTTIAASIRFRFNEHWNLKLRGGESDNSFSTDTITFGSVSLAYLF